MCEQVRESQVGNSKNVVYICVWISKGARNSKSVTIQSIVPQQWRQWGRHLDRTSRPLFSLILMQKHRLRNHNIYQTLKELFSLPIVVVPMQIIIHTNEIILTMSSVLISRSTFYQSKVIIARERLYMTNTDLEDVIPFQEIFQIMC